MASDTISLEFIGRAIQSMQKDVTTIKSDTAEMRRIMILLSEKATRTDRHIAEVKDDLELMIKSELMGSITNLESKLDNRLDKFVEDIKGYVAEKLAAPLT